MGSSIYDPHVDRVDVALRALALLYKRNKHVLLEALGAPPKEAVLDMWGEAPQPLAKGTNTLRRVMPVIREHPELLDVAARMLGLYYETTEESRGVYFDSIATWGADSAVRYGFVIPAVAREMAASLRASGVPAQGQVYKGRDMLFVTLPVGVGYDFIPLLQPYTPVWTRTARWDGRPLDLDSLAALEDIEGGADAYL